MRIFEVLLKKLIKEICDLDNLGNEKEPDLEKHLNIKKWIDILQDDANINVSPHSFDKDGHAGITREFTGGEILKILSVIEIEKSFPNIEFAEKKVKFGKISII